MPPRAFAPGTDYAQRPPSRPSARPRASRQRKLDARWLAAIQPSGFGDVRSYLQQRHLTELTTANALANEVAVSFHAGKAAL